jgi:outer membrane immunogenic protein
MKKIILAMVLAGFGSTAVLAADLTAPYTKAPIMADQVYSWTGFYIGGDVGGANANHNFTSNFTNRQSETDPTLLNNVQHDKFDGTSFVGGVHAGYNWQFARNMMIGVEGDWQSVRSKHSFCRQTDIDSIACVDGSTIDNAARGFGSVGGELNWVATARARLGWTMDRVMIYGTGGAAFANVKSSLALNCLGDGCGDSSNKLAVSTNSSSQNTGWVLGAGAEWMLTRNWIVRAEYQHIDLGNTSSSLSPDCGVGCSLSAKQSVRLDILRAGLSYKFGG